MKHSITLFVDGQAILAKHSNPAIRRLFNTDTLPTPYYVPEGCSPQDLSRIRLQALEAVRALNPEFKVEWAQPGGPDVLVVPRAGAYLFQGITAKGLQAVLQVSVREDLQAGMWTQPALQARAIQKALEELGCKVGRPEDPEPPCRKPEGV